MKYADKIKAKFVMVIGDSELEENCAKLKNMETHEERDVPLDEGFFDKFYSAYMDNNNSKLLEQLEV